MLETFDLKAMGHNTCRYVHTVTEALKLALADRPHLEGSFPAG
jgi:gamma-glutamyltranspeptidase/glutathione hydrolase